MKPSSALPGRANERTSSHMSNFCIARVVRQLLHKPKQHMRTVLLAREETPYLKVFDDPGRGSSITLQPIRHVFHC